MVTFAIDRIPSIGGAYYASYRVLEEGQSDGVPEFIGDGGDSLYVMPKPPKQSVSLDDTIPMRRPL